MDDAPDLIWVEEIPREAADAHWRMVDAGGMWLHLVYRRRERCVLAHAESRLDPSRRLLVFRAINDAGFFDLESRYPPPDVAVEGDTVVVAARIGAHHHRVVARPPRYLPRPLEQIIDFLRDAGIDVIDHKPAPRYWRAASMDAARATRVRRRAMLPHFSLERSSPPPLPPSLLQAVADPGLWAPICAEDVSRSDALAGDRGEFVLETLVGSVLVELWRGE